MTVDVVTAAPQDSVAEVARRLARHRIGAVPVIDGGGLVRGIVAESDLLTGSAAGTAEEAMVSPALTVTADTTVPEARALLLARDIGRLPITDGDGRLIGIVSRSDLLRASLPADDDLRRQVVDRVVDCGGEVYSASVVQGTVTVRGRVAHAVEIPVLRQMLRQTPGVVDVSMDFAADDA